MNTLGDRLRTLGVSVTREAPGMYALAIAGHSLRCAGAALDIEDAAGILARDVLARLLRGERDPFGAPPPPEIPHRPFGRPRPVHNT